MILLRPHPRNYPAFVVTPVFATTYNQYIKDNHHPFIADQSHFHSLAWFLLHPNNKIYRRYSIIPLAPLLSIWYIYTMRVNLIHYERFWERLRAFEDRAAVGLSHLISHSS